MDGNQFPVNPYVIGVPLTGDAGFYGREDAFVFIEDILETEQQNVVVFYGQRRVGKTSLLHQIAKKFMQKGAVVPVYFDLQGKEQKSLSEVLYDLSRTVARSLKIGFPEQDKFDEAGRFFRNEFLLSVNKKLENKRLLLLFDEFDVLGDEITKTGAASETLFPYLQDLIMHQRQIIFVFVVGRRIEELTTHFQSIFKQAVYRQIGLLKENNAKNLIAEPVRDFLTYEDSAIEAILNLTCGHPYFTQLICFESFNDAKKKSQRVIGKADVLNLVDQNIESGHGALNWFWDGLPRAERFIMAAVAHVTDKSGLASQEDIRRILEKHKIVLTGLELTDAPDRLVEWDMLRRKPDSDNYYFVIELVRRWILKSHPLESARRDVDLISKRASRLYENARDAHSDGDLEYARAEYQRALDANPNHSGAQLGLAQVLFELGNFKSAIEEFEKAYSIDEISARDGLVQARQKYGKILVQKGREKEALFQYEQALKIAPTNEKIRLSLAGIWRVRGDNELIKKDLAHSIDNYKKALSYEESEMTARPIRDSLMTYVEQKEAEGNDNETSLIIEQIKSFLPEDEKVRSFEIGFWTRQGDQFAKDDNKGANAIKAYKRALELNPNDKTLTGKLKAVSTDWEKLLKADSLFKKALAAHKDQNWSEAESAWQQMIKMNFLEYNSYHIAEFLAEAHNRISKSPSINLQLIPPWNVTAGKEEAWTAILNNDGYDDLNDVVVTFNGNQKSEPIMLPPNNETKIKFSRTFEKTGQMTVQASVTAVSSGGKTVSNEITVSVDVLNPSIKLKLVPPQDVTVGKETTWNARLHNDGNDDLSNVVVFFDENQKSEPISLPPDGETKIKFSRTFEKIGQKTVQASVTAVSSEGEAISNEITVSVDVLNPSIKLKLVPPRDVTVGKESTWTVRLHNDGNDDLSNVIVIFNKILKSEPIVLPTDKETKIKFSRTFEKIGQKTVQASVTAVSGGGKAITSEDTISVDVLERRPSANGKRHRDQTAEPADIKSEKKETIRKGTPTKNEDPLPAKSHVTIWPSVILATTGWAGAGAIFTFFYVWGYIAYIPIYIPILAAGGLATHWALMSIIPNIQRNRIFFASLFWAMGGGTIWITLRIFYGPIPYWDIPYLGAFFFIVEPFGLAVGGSLAAISLRRSLPGIQLKRIFFISLGWYTGWIISWIICMKIIWSDFFYNAYDYIDSGLLYFVYSCFWAVTGAIGSGVMLQVIRKAMRSS